jgi:hypothetical protein
MDGYVHIDSNFVNQKYKPMYPDRTLDRRIEKLCKKVDQLVDLNARQIVEKTFFKEKDKPKKYPFWYLVVGVLVVLFLYFKIKSPVNPNVGGVVQPPVGHRPSGFQVRSPS